MAIVTHYRIDQSLFQFWEGDPPGLACQQVETSFRAGTYGHSEMLLGRWGETFQSRLTSHWVSQLKALQALAIYQSGFIGKGVFEFVYNDVNFTRTFRTGLSIHKVKLVECQTCVRLIGPGYDYIGGVKLVTDWTMTPLDWSGPNGNQARNPRA